MNKRILNKTDIFFGKRLMKLETFNINNFATFPKWNNFLSSFFHLLQILFKISVPWISVLRKDKFSKNVPLKDRLFTDNNFFSFDTKWAIFNIFEASRVIFPVTIWTLHPLYINLINKLISFVTNTALFQER